MTPLIIAQLLGQFGIPLTQYVISLFQQGNTVLTADQLAAIVADVNKLAQYRSSDSLAAAGIQIVNGKVVPV